MSTIWTPSGERPIRREPEPEPPATPRRPAPGEAGTRAPQGGEAVPDEELAARMMEVQQELLRTPAALVVANHCIGLFQLGVLHLEQETPNLAEAKLAIDAMAAVVETLGPRLGKDADPLREALTQIRLGYVQRQQEAAGPPHPA